MVENIGRVGKTLFFLTFFFYIELYYNYQIYLDLSLFD